MSLFYTCVMYTGARAVVAGARALVVRIMLKVFLFGAKTSYIATLTML